MASIGVRLRNERKRLGKSQAEFSKIGDVSKNTQASYEKEPGDDGYTSPTLDYLIKLSDYGVDVHYIMFGTYRDASTEPHVDELTVLVRQMPPAQQAMGFAMLYMVQQTAKAGAIEDAEIVWRAARLFGQFFKMDQAGREMVELAAEGGLTPVRKC